MEVKVIDGRNLPPPEPLEKVLAALVELSAEDEILLLLHCQPHPLYEILRREGYNWKNNLLNDGTWEVHIRKAS